MEFWCVITAPLLISLQVNLTILIKHVFTLKLLNWTNLRAFGYDSLPILTYKLHCTSKTDALKWPGLSKP